MFFKIHRGDKPRTGFALVSSLVVITMLGLLALAFTQLSLVEQKYSASLSAQSCAKANAKLAMQIAISQLQHYTGKDQAITCRADLLDTRTSPESTPDPALHNPYYTAVFPTEKYEASGTSEGIFLRKVARLPTYLISGNEAYDMLQWTGHNPPEGYTTAAADLTRQDAVTLVTGDKKVTVPKVHLPNGGSYAYWVSDEGCKARINTEDIDRAKTTSKGASTTHNASAFNSLRAPSQTRPTELTELPEPERNLSLSTIRLHSDKHQQLLTSHPHAYTTTSRSVLCDLQNGGLKKNLTAAVNLNDAAFRDLTLHAKAEASQASPVFLYQQWTFPCEQETQSYSHYAGAPWDLIRSYIRRPEWEPTLTGRSPQLYSHLGSLAHQLPNYWQSSDAPYRRHMDARLVRRHPIITRIQISFDYSVSYQGLVIENDSHWHSYTIRQHFMPLVILWNPYNADLTITEPVGLHLYLDKNWSSGRHNTELEITPATTAEWKIYALDEDTENASPQWSAPMKGTRAFTYPYHPNGNATSKSELSRLSFHIPTHTIPSGKTAVFSAPVGNRLLQYNKTSNPLQYGYSPGYGFFSKNAEIRIRADSENAPKVDAPTLKVLRYPTEGGSEHTRLQLTNHASFQRINWDFADILPSSNIKFTPQQCKDNEPLSSGTSNGAQSPQFTAALIRKFPDISHHIGKSAQWITPSNKLNTNQFNAPWNVYFNTSGSRYGAYGAHPQTSDAFTAPPQYLSGIAIGNSSLVQPELSPDSEAFVGHTDSFSSGSVKAIQHALPRHETRCISLAHLTHLNTSKWVSNYNADQSNASATDAFTPSSCIGNSFLPPHIPPSQTHNTVVDKHAYSSDSTSTHFDQSFIYNQCLWDRFFLTGARPDDILHTDKNLDFCPNKNLEAIDPLDQETWDDPHRTATKLLLRGGFNIHSTSVKAWEAILSLTRGLQVPGSSAVPTDTSPFPSIQYTASTPLTTAPHDPSDKALYDGSMYRALTDQEIHDLASAIVIENKLRGPLPTLSQWINRSLHPRHHHREWARNLPLTQDEVCYEGTLQAALNRTSINGIFNSPNSSYTPQLIADPDSPFDFQQGKLNTKTFKYHHGYGAPASLTQARILQRIGHLLTARSDTFTIRAYGEHRDLKGNITASAYCEAVVQRFPAYHDKRNLPETPPLQWTLNTKPTLQGQWHKNPQLHQRNHTLGRRYSVIQFRWLSPNEI